MPAPQLDTASFQLLIDNGYDPILGPPYAPVNFSAFAETTAPRIYWTIPDIIVSATQTSPGNNTVVVTLANYASAPLGTVFYLYWYQGGRAAANIKLLGGSDGSHGPGYPVLFNITYSDSPPTFTVHFSPIEEAPFNLILFATAVSGGTTIYSPNLPFTVT